MAQDETISVPYETGPDAWKHRFQTEYRVAPVDPDEYVVGTGDEITISFTSDQIVDIQSEVNSSVNIFIKSVGLIELGNIPLRQAIDYITQRVGQIYPKADFSVQLTKFRIVRVNVIGEVRNPGIYYVPAVWRVSEVIELAGGLTEHASRRNISLRGLSQERRIDLVRFQAMGQGLYNPLVGNGNIIEVPARLSADEYVAIAGLVRRPGTLEFVAGDRLGDLILYAGGPKGDQADMEAIISDTRGKEIARLDGAEAAFSDWGPTPGNNIRLTWKENRTHYGAVDIYGAVPRPGRYLLNSPHFTLGDLLGVCGGASPEGNADMIQVYRRLDENLSLTGGVDNSETASADIAGPIQATIRLSLDPRRPMDAADLELVDGDSLFIPFRTGMVEVTGAVASPGLVKFEAGRGADYYIEQAGGLGYDADKQKAVIINPYTGGRISAGRGEKLFDGEIIHIPPKESKVRP